MTASAPKSRIAARFVMTIAVASAVIAFVGIIWQQTTGGVGPL